MSISMEVRCCCKPQRLLGWLKVPDTARRGTIIHFTVWPSARAEVNQASFEVKQISLPVDTYAYAENSYHERLALRSEDTPIETLRLIPGFKENVA